MTKYTDVHVASSTLLTLLMYILFLGMVVVVGVGVFLVVLFLHLHIHICFWQTLDMITTFDEKINNYVLLLYSVYVFT